MHDQTVMLSFSVFDEAIVLDKFNIVCAHDHSDVSRFHLAWCLCDLLRGEEELRQVRAPRWAARAKLQRQHQDATDRTGKADLM